MKSKRMALVTALLASGLFTGSASAVLPDSGWYWNPAESGRGFNIEIQDNVLFIAGFIYDTSGNPIWVFSGGPMSDDHTYSGAAFQTANGQPLGGAYRAETTVPFGNATVTWTDTVDAIITINGYSFSETRQIFGFDFTSTTQPMLGEFALVTGDESLPVYFGERISFTSTQTANGAVYAVGNRSGDTGPDNTAIAAYQPSLGMWTILLDSSTDYYDFYTFIFDGVNLVEGQSSVYLKTSSPDGSLNMVGSRVKSAQAVAGEDAPGVSNEAKRPVDQTDAASAARAAAQVARTFDPTTMELLHGMEAALQAANR